MSTPTEFYVYSNNYIFYLIHVSTNIPSTIDNIVIMSHRRELHNKNCYFLNSSIIFLLPPYFTLYYVMNIIVTAVYSPSLQLCRYKRKYRTNIIICVWIVRVEKTNLHSEPLTFKDLYPWRRKWKMYKHTYADTRIYYSNVTKIYL